MRNYLADNINLTPPALREVSIKIAAVDGINLGQGVCRMPAPQLVIDAAKEAMDRGENLYSPAQGVLELRKAIAKKLVEFNKIDTNPDNIVITLGATGAFENVCETFLNAGDEVVSFVPYYPYHYNALSKKQVLNKQVRLHAPNWEFDPSELKNAFSKKTKFIILSTPNNPTGKVFTRKELELIAEHCIANDCLCVTDEVYEYLTYDGREHISMASIPEMQSRTITMGSYSKTFAITGWRIGYLNAVSNLINPLRLMNDKMYVCAPTPFQHAVADGINKLGADYYSQMLEKYTQKRDLLSMALTKAGLKVSKPQGAYYILGFTDEKFPNIPSDQAIDTLISQAKVGAVPASDFVGASAKTDPKIGNFFRFCYSMPDELLVEAGRRLGNI